jgi:molecular chaperone DnaK
MSKIIGIDLGTTNSAMAYLVAGKPEVITNAEGNRTTPSVVAIKNGERLVGATAQKQRVTNPKNTIYGIKRLIGRKFDDNEVQKDIKISPFEIKKIKNGVGVVMDGKDYTPEEISAMTLSKLKADAEAFLGEPVTEAVITVPAYFDDSQRQATKDAGKIAGLEVKRIINEPTAAALAYGLESKKEEKIAVFDLGGGTFDISILELGDGVFEVKSTNGDTHLGGEDFDNRIVNFLLEEIENEYKVDLKDNEVALQRVKEEAEKAKKELSSATEVEINMPFLAQTNSGEPINFEYKMTRAKLEDLVKDLIDATADPCIKALKDAGLKASEVNEVVLVGGMTRMPAVVEKVKQIFGKDPLKGVNPDEVVAVGAAIQGGVLAGDVKDILLLDVTPLTLGIETAGGVRTPMIDRNTTVPTSKSQVFSTYSDNQPQVEVHVLQGEREMAGDNKSLGMFILGGIAPAPRGVPQIEVTFSIDANGILSVSAKDKGTGKENSITIQNSGNLSKDDIEKAQKEAEANAEDDKKKKELVEARNILENTIYQAKKMPDEYKDKISDDDKKTIEEAAKKAEEKLDSENKEDLDAAFKELSETLQKIGAKLYEAAAKEEQAKESEGSDEKTNVKRKKAKDDDTAVEGEVVDKK